jgi:spore coat protein A, manganese oxidase
VRRNSLLTVRHTNELPEPVSVHLHGGHTGPASDGHPSDLVAANGGTKDYVYPNDQIAAPLWYHDHAQDLTGPHMWMGLAGMYIIGDAIEDALNLPGGPLDGNNTAFDVPLVISDRTFNRDGSFAYTLTDEAILRGMLGDRILVNGVIQPFFNVPQRKMRFRIVNASNARIYDLRLSNGNPFIQIGSDGGLLAQPINRTSLRLAPAERADVVIDFNGMLGQSVVLRNANRQIPLDLDRAPRDLMRFNVTTAASDSPAIPGTLRTITPLANPTSFATLNLTRGTQSGRPVWFINGQLFDPAHVEVPITNGAISEWTFNNNSTQPHPMHIHLVQFQIQSINGGAPGPGENGWKDTVLVPPGGQAVVRAQFSGQPGTYVFHCHNIEHEDHSMMNQFSVS